MLMIMNDADTLRDEAMAKIPRSSQEKSLIKEKNALDIATRRAEIRHCRRPLILSFPYCRKVMERIEDTVI